MSLIRETEENQDPRQDITQLDFIPPPPAPEPEQPAQILANPEFDPSQYDVPNPNLPDPSLVMQQQIEQNEGIQQAQDAGAIEGENFQPSGATVPEANPITIINPPPPTNFGGAPTDSQIDAAAAQIGVNQYGNLLNQYSTDSLGLHTSGEMYPTLYEGTPITVERTTVPYGLLHLSVEEGIQKTNQANFNIAPQREKTGRNFRPNSTGNPFTNGTIPGFMQSALEFGERTIRGFTSPTNDFDPVGGFKDVFEEMKENPWAATSILLPVIPIINGISKSSYGDYGDGAIGAVLWGLSTAQSATAGALTDLYQFVSGNKKPVGNKPNIAQAIMSGEDYAFTQRANEQHPIAVIGSKKAPRTVEEIKQRSWLWNNPVAAPALEITRLLTGNKLPTRVNLPGEKFDFSVGRAYQVVEGTIGLVLDTITDPLTYIPGANVAAAGNRLKKTASQAIGSINPNTVQQGVEQAIRNTTPPPAIIQPTKVTQALAPTAAVPPPKPASILLPGIPIHNAPPPSQLIRSISSAPPGSVVVPDQLVHALRSNEELTQIAKLRGEVPPSRLKPLSRTRLNMIEQHFPNAQGVYRTFGTPVDLRAADEAIQQIPGSQIPTVDVPLPSDFQNSIVELSRRAETIRGSVTENLPNVKPDYATTQQIAKEMDTLLDNVVGDIDTITEPAVIAQVNRKLPKEMQSVSREGVEQITKLTRQERLYDEAAEAVQETTVELERSMEALQPALDELDELPDVGRRLINEPIDFNPDSVAKLPELDIPDLTPINTIADYKPFVQASHLDKAAANVAALRESKKGMGVAALHVYQTGSQYIYANAYLRGGWGAVKKAAQEAVDISQGAIKIEDALTQAQGIIKLIPSIKQGIDELPEEAGTFFRGVSLPAKEASAIRRKYAAGREVTEFAFTSVTSNPDVATRFGSQAASENNLGILFEIEGNGRKFIYDESQAEYLFNSGTRFRSLGLEESNNSFRIKLQQIEDFDKVPFYHGSRVEDLDLRTVDPVIGSARHEYGVGIYLTRNQDEAVENAFGSAHRNLPELPERSIGVDGVVYDVQVSPQRVMEVTDPLSGDAASIVEQIIRSSEIEPDVAKKIIRQIKEEAPIRNIFNSINTSGEPEEVLLNVQRAIATGLRNTGVDALADDDLLVIINPRAIQDNTEILRKTVDNSVEQAGYRYNAASRTDSRTMGEFTSVAFKEARVDLQSKLMQQMEDINEQARQLGDDAAQRLIDAEKQLRETVRAEQARIRQQRYESNYKKDMLENEHLQNKTEGWCL